MPALGLVFKWFPADKDVEPGFAFKDGGKSGLERLSGAQAIGGTGFVGFGVFGLLLNPVSQVAVSEFLQHGVVQLMVVDQGVETIGATVPEMPDKGAVVEELGVLLKKLVAQPVFEGFGFAPLESRGGDEGAFVKGAESSGEELPQTRGGGLLAAERRQADDAVFVGERFQSVRAEGGTIGKAAAGLARPAVAGQALALGQIGCDLFQYLS